jgi:uncharacterized membrane protein
MVFTYSGGDTMVEEFIHNLPAKEMSFILISMGIILILGFFIDFVEISPVGVAMPEKIEPSTATMSEIGGTMALATLKSWYSLFWSVLLPFQWYLLTVVGTPWWRNLSTTYPPKR